MENMSRRLTAEFIGTFWLVLGGCGAAVLAANFVAPHPSGTPPAFPSVNIGFVGVSLAFGLTVLTGVYALGHISGGHFNPAVTLGAFLDKRVEAKAVLPYMVTQLVAAIAAAGVLAVVANGAPGFNLKKSGFAANGFADHSPGHYDWQAAFVIEVVLTAVFVLVILGATSRGAPTGFAGVAIGLTLTLIHLISIPVTNTSVNPARSLGPAVFVGGWAIKQLWMFFVAPLVGAVLGALIYRMLADRPGIEVESGAATQV
jgi:aquaporin Z